MQVLRQLVGSSSEIILTDAIVRCGSVSPKLATSQSGGEADSSCCCCGSARKDAGGSPSPTAL